MSPRAAIRALATAAALTLGAPAAGHASTTQETQFQDDTLLVFRSPAEVARTLDMLRGLGVDRIRVSMYWNLIAPNAGSTTRPSFNAADPSAYPRAGWARYDLILRLASERGMSVNWDLMSPAPAWASQPTSDPNYQGHYYPSAAEFGQFAQAVGARYSGAYTPPSPTAAGGSASTAPTPPSSSGGGGGLPLPLARVSAAQARVAANDPVARAADTGGPLPRVSYYSLWNEPNEYNFLAPQWGSAGSRVIEPAAAIYRSLVDAGMSGLAASGHGADTILIGETAPKGKSYPGPTNSLKPLRFLRALYCVDSRLRPLGGGVAAALGCPTSDQVRAFPAAHPGLFRATGWGHHPYSLVTPPGFRSPAPDDLGFADLARLPRTLRAIFSRYRVGRRGLPTYLTEFGYQSRPPDPFGFPPALQAAYLNQSEFTAYRDRGIRSYTQFLLVDDPPATQYPPSSTLYWGTFQTGLVGLNGVVKPAFSAFRLPLYMPSSRRRGPGRLRVWGALRPAPNGTRQVAQVQFRSRGRGARYRTIARPATANYRNYVDARVRFAGSGTVRLAWRDPSTGRTLYSREVPVRIG